MEDSNKKIKLCITDYDYIEQKFAEYWETKRTKHLFYRDGDFYFQSNFYPEEKIELTFNRIEFNQELVDNIAEIVGKSVSICKKLMSSNEYMGDEKDKGSIKNAIDSLIQSLYHEKHTNSIFNLASRIFIKIINGHFLTNGNKRLALVATSEILLDLGWYWKWSHNHHLSEKEFYDDNFQGQIEKWADKLENNSQDMSQNNLSKDIIQKEIEIWISDNVIINIPWFIKNKK